MPAVNPLRHAKRAAQDQVIGATQRAGLKPTTVGIARQRLIARAITRAVDCADTIHTLVAARDSDDPASQEIARRLLSNQEFLGAMHAAVERIQADVKASMSEPVAAEPSPPSANADPTSPGATEAPDDDPTRGGSGFPGADSATRPRASGSYTESMMLADLAVQNAAANTLVQRDPHTSMDEALARISATPLVPDWSSPVWSAAARSAFRERAMGDGFARAHMAKAGDSPGWMNDTATGDDTDRAIARLEGRQQ